MAKLFRSTAEFPFTIVSICIGVRLLLADGKEKWSEPHFC